MQCRMTASLRATATLAFLAPTRFISRTPTAHERKALLIARHQLVDMRVRIDNQLRGILKTFGLVIGKCSRGQLGQRAQELSEGRPGIESIVVSMVAVRQPARADHRL